MEPNAASPLDELARLQSHRWGADPGNGQDHAPAGGEHPLILSPADPLASARRLIERRYTLNGLRTLHHHGGDFYAYSGPHYAPLDPATVRARAYEFLEGAFRVTEGRDLVPFQPTTAKVNNVIDALAAASNLPSSIQPPTWIGEASADLPNPREMLACQNGLLHLPTLDLIPSTPAFFGVNALDFGYEAYAPEPTEWLRFLAQLWPTDQESIDALQELFGYYLVSDTSQQKIGLAVGPRRSGKGTVARVLTQVLGRENVCSPTLASLGQNFGLAPLIGKTLAIIADARLGGRADQAAIVERLLSISGEDGLTIDRKFLPAWTGTLPTRFLVLTNELPKLADASGALAGRFIVLPLTTSFYGREDHGLTERLLTELPGILNWAIAGWRRLRDRGHLVQPNSARDAIQALEDLASPINAFIRDECVVDPYVEIERDALYEAWRGWCEREGRTHPGTKDSFSRYLRAAVPCLQDVRPREDGERVRKYRGIGLRPVPRR